MIGSPEGTPLGFDRVEASATTNLGLATARHAAGAAATVRTIAIVGATLVAYFALALGYATLTPIWQNPDEPAHYNYVVYVAQTGGLPVLQPGDWDSALLERLKNGRLEQGDSVAAIRYEGWQPPLFYLLAAPVFRLGATDDPAAAVLRLRAFDVLLGAFTLVFAYLAGREVLPQPLASVVPAVVAGVPMFTAVSAAISADPLANLLAVLILLALLYRIGRTVRPERWAVATGALIGLGLLTKVAVAVFVPLAIVLIFARAARPIRESVLLLLTSAVLVTPWLVHQVSAYGWMDPLAVARHAAVVADQPRFPGLTPDYSWSFLTTSFHSFWAQFGWMAIVAPDRLYWVWGILTLLALGGLLVRRPRFDDPAAGWLLVGTVAVAVAAYIGYNLSFEQFQGRYLFTALVPLAVLFLAGTVAWLPRSARAGGGIALGVVLLTLNAYALLRVLVPGFQPGT